MTGQIRVGSRIYTGRHKHTPEPKIAGFTNILCLTKSSPYGYLGPYILRDERGYLMENIWQFTKIYEQVPSHTDRDSGWTHPAEDHYNMETKTFTEQFWQWREKGMRHTRPVRYPIGWRNRHTCKGAMFPNLQRDGQTDQEIRVLNYIEARREIYLPLYCRLVRKVPGFQKLRERLRAGESLLIVEVDGPREESLPYYKEKYGVADNFITQNTVEVNAQNMRILLHDPGHVYCLAIALLDMEEAVMSPAPSLSSFGVSSKRKATSDLREQDKRPRTGHGNGWEVLKPPPNRVTVENEHAAL